MTYQEMHPGLFLRRPNRFIAHIEIDGKEEICHVKNTGRCRELLTPGAKVYCEKAASPLRKTRYDLIAVEKGSRLINMDSQAPNKAAGEWLASGGLGKIENLRPETPFRDSRIDFSFQKDGKPCLLEVKGVTLEEDGICSFPDAPTLRGAKHLKELSQAVSAGYKAYVLFVIQMGDAACLRPHWERDPAFSQALVDAASAGVEILAYDCQVTPSTMEIRNPVPVKLEKIL